MIRLISKHRGLVFVLLLALSIRLIPVFVNLTFWPRMASLDAFDYREMALSLNEGRGLAYRVDSKSFLSQVAEKKPGRRLEWVTTAGHPPGYPICLAAIYWVRDSLRLVLAVQALLGVATVFVLYLVARSATSERAALVTAGGAALNPFFFVFGWLEISEGLFMFVLSFTLLLIVIWIKTARFRWMVLSALAHGVLILVHPQACFFLPAVAVTLWKCSRERLRAIGAYTSIVALVLAPWTIRNYLAFHDFIPLSTVGGFNFFLGTRALGEHNWPTTQFEWKQYPEIRRQIQGKSEVEINRLLIRSGWEYIRAHPGICVVGCLSKALRSLKPGPLEGGMLVLYLLVAIPLFGLALFGAASRMTRDPPRLLVVTMVVCYFVVASTLTFAPRHRAAAIDPLICVMASWGIERIARKRLETASRCLNDRNHETL